MSNYTVKNKKSKLLIKEVVMGKKLTALLATGVLMFAITGMAHSAVITNEDFEGGATGWSNNTTTIGGSPFTTFLGRFAGSSTGAQMTSKSYTLSGTQTQVTIQFDFYEIDSWDREYFKVYVNDMAVISDMFNHNVLEGGYTSGQTTRALLFPDVNKNLGFSGYQDQGYRYTYTFDTTSTTLKLGFGATLDSDIGDESWGVDNINITDNSSAVPLPGALWLLGTGLFGLAGMRRKKSNQA